jgi:aminoglycoside/choline kinase family phosphotransferase
VDNIIPTQVSQKYDEKIPISSKNFNLGIIDFQDALVGSPAYDLSSLIEDVRAPINEEMKKKIIFIYKVTTKAFIKINSSKIGKPDPQWHKITTQYEDEDLYYKLKNIAEDSFNDLETKVSYFSIQRNLKILGIFCRLKYRDKKTNYIKYLPQAKKFVRDNLKNPQFEELKNWFIENKINV